MTIRLIIALITLLAAAVVIIYSCLQKLKAAAAANEELQSRLKKSRADYAAAINLHNKQIAAQSTAAAQKQTLKETTDAKLEDRADSLFAN